MEYLIKSVYRFMSKMENLSIAEEEMFTFLRRSFHLSSKDIKPELQKLLLKLKKHEHNRFETRAFLYLDVISWLESKIENIPVQEVIQKKFNERRRRAGKIAG
jgi:CII-binding regulator of phage lambda lysogenization HflD